MKKKIFTALLSFLFIGVFAKEFTKQNKQIEGVTEIESQKPLGDCTFTIKGNFDGVEVDLEITVSDVSWLECKVLKSRVKQAMQ